MQGKTPCNNPWTERKLGSLMLYCQFHYSYVQFRALKGNKPFPMQTWHAGNPKSRSVFGFTTYLSSASLYKLVVVLIFEEILCNCVDFAAWKIYLKCHYITSTGLAVYHIVNYITFSCFVCSNADKVLSPDFDPGVAVWWILYDEFYTNRDDCKTLIWIENENL